LIATGTVEGVIRDAALTTFVIGGKDIGGLVTELAGAPGVEQIAPFGATLHVVGRDGALLAKTLEKYAQRDGITIERGDTNLEDVFIQLMSSSQDNMR
jgi:ABC-2 type transport system ATP-binding protein